MAITDFFGLRLIAGEFGHGKSKNTFQQAFLWKQANPDGILIANVPYDFVDIKFNSKEDLDKILDFLVRYIECTNTVQWFRDGYYPPIRVIVDEAHCYYFSRDFKAFDRDTLIVLTQCRKRLIAIDFITQKLGQVDVFLRRLCNDVLVFVPYILGFSHAVWYSMIDPEATSIVVYDPKAEIPQRPTAELISKELLFPDWFQKRMNKSLVSYFEQRYLTYHVITSKNALDDFSFNQFMEIINERVDREAEYQKVLRDKKLKNVSEVLSSEESSMSEGVEDHTGFSSHKISE